MKQRIKNLNLYQKGLLLLMLVMTAVFAVLYRVNISRVGFLYKDKIFVPKTENGQTIYTGKLDGTPSEFTVSGDKTSVTFRCGDTIYGPYTIEEDPSALADLLVSSGGLTGVALYDGETLLFRGGYRSGSDYFQLYHAEGSPLAELGVYFVTDDGVMKDAAGNVIDPLKPDAETILHLALAPELTHKGTWLAWFGAVCISLLNALSMLYEDELFRWNLSFRIRNVEDAEPSEWEMLDRYLGWTALFIGTVVIYILGLR